MMSLLIRAEPAVLFGLCSHTRRTRFTLTEVWVCAALATVPMDTAGLCGCYGAFFVQSKSKWCVASPASVAGVLLSS